jgi:hypothetical protein
VFRLQRWALELAHKKKVKFDKEQKEAAREQRRQNGGASISSKSKHTAEHSDAPKPASDAATTKGAHRAARHIVPPKTPAVLGKDGVVCVGVPIDSRRRVETKEAALGGTGGSTVETVAEEPASAVAAVLSGAEPDLPEMTDAEFIAWMETFIEASNRETPDEEGMLQQYAVRQAARRAALTAVPRSGLSGLRVGRPAASGGLAAGDASRLLSVAGVSTFQSARPASRESLPEILFSHTTGVKILRSEENDTYNPYPRERQGQRGASSLSPTKKITARDQLRGAASNRVITSHGALPETYELVGDGLRLPAINQMRAAKMTWSGTMPALVSAMSTVDKEKAWKTFENMELSSAAKEAYAELLADEPEPEPGPPEPAEAFLTLPPIDSARRLPSAETETTRAAGASFTSEAFWREEDNAAEQAVEVKLSLEFEATSSRSSARSPPSATFVRRAEVEEAVEAEGGEGNEDEDEERNEEQLDQALRAMLSSLEGKFWDDGPRQPFRTSLGVFEPLPAPSAAPEPAQLPRAGLTGASMAIGGAAHADGRRPPPAAPALKGAKKAVASAQREPRVGPRRDRAAAASRPVAEPVPGAESAVAAATVAMAKDLISFSIDLGAADGPRPRSPETPMPVLGGPRQTPGARQPLVASAPTPTPPPPPSATFADAVRALEPLSPLSAISTSLGGDPSPVPLEPRSLVSAVPSDSSGAPPATKEPPPLGRSASGKQPQLKKQDSDAKPKRGLAKAASTTDKKDGKAKDKKKGSAKKKKAPTARSGASLEDDGEDDVNGEDDDDDAVVMVTLEQIESERIPEQPYVVVRQVKKVDRLKKKEKVHSWSLLSKADIKKVSNVNSICCAFAARNCSCRMLRDFAGKLLGYTLERPLSVYLLNYHHRSFEIGLTSRKGVDQAVSQRS